MEKKSFIKKTTCLMAVQFLLLFLVLLFFVFFSYRTAVYDTTQSIDNFMQILGNELENKIENADMLLERLIYKNANYDLLQSEEEAARYYASMELRKLMNESMAYNPYVDAILIGESRYETILSSEKAAVGYKQRKALQSFVRDCSKDQRRKAEWTIQKIGVKPYLYKMYVWQEKAAGIFISAENFMSIAADSDLENLTLFLTDQTDTVWGSYGAVLQSVDPGSSRYISNPKGSWESRFELEEGAIRIYSCISRGSVLGQIKWGMIGMLLIIFVSFLFVILFLFHLYREMIQPMRVMTEQMKRMQMGNHQFCIEEEYQNKEFSMLKDNFNELMSEIVGLKIKSYEKQILLQETEMKCVKLQIRPHFFLNAMTTISSLSMQGKNKEIQSYIEALSKNIRYMFCSGLHTVLLEEEIRHVENYFDMQELKYPGCVFYSIEMEPEAAKWKIPQMLIHTIIENEYKYAIALNSVLTILITARIISGSDGEELLLEIEDDGKGYPEEVLGQFYGSDEPANEQSARKAYRIGLWSIRRMLELMYEGNGLFQISNIEPHGCLNSFRIPKEPVTEVHFEIIQNKFD